MKELFIINSGGKKSLFPVVVGLPQPAKNIFAVPAKDAIGTIDIENAIAFLEFHDDAVQLNIIKKNFQEEVSGDYYFSFLPVYSDNEIAYAQSRWVIVQNIKNGKNSTVFVINNLDDLIGKMAVLNPEKGLFIIEILKGHPKGWERRLGIGTLTEENFKPKASVVAGLFDGLPGKPSGYFEPWTVSGGKIFVYDDTSKTIKVYDESGKPSSHPIQTIFNNNKKKFRRIKEIAFHHELPFALISEEGLSPEVEADKIRGQRDANVITSEQCDSIIEPLYTERDRHVLWLFRWDTSDEKKQLIPLLSNLGNLVPSLDSVTAYEDFQFSPDGKWLVFGDCTESSDNPVFISMRVNKDKPYFFEDPLYLGKVLRQGFMVRAEGKAWIENPTSFVVTDGLALYKWELGNINSAKVINQ